MTKELFENLYIKSGEVVVDATLGGGGHFDRARQYLDQEGVLIGIDMDASVVEREGERVKGQESRAKSQEFSRLDLKIECIHDNFINIDRILKDRKIEGIDVIYADLGFSTDQLDDCLSFQKDGILDLRLDKNLNVKACDLVNGFFEKELISIFVGYADEALSVQIAKEIVRGRKLKLIETKFELNEIIEKVAKRYKRDDKQVKKITQKIYQALRIAVNNELDNLKSFLKKGFEVLNSGGRLAVISFHSGEDRIVNKYFKKCEDENKAEWIVKLETPKIEEIAKNPKSRSAKLRIVRKL